METGGTVKNYTKFNSIRVGDPLPLRGCPPKVGRIRSYNEFTDILRINPPLGGQGGQLLRLMDFLFKPLFHWFEYQIHNIRFFKHHNCQFPDILYLI